MLNTESTYIFDQFCRQYDLDYYPGAGYGFDSASRVRISDAGRAFITDRVIPDTDRAVWHRFGDVRLPVLFHDGHPEPVTRDGSISYIHFDLFAECFFWLSGWQECMDPERDPYGRFPWKRSYQYHWGITERPVVNYFFQLLADELGVNESARAAAAQKTPASPSPQKSRPFSVALTHDIDRITTGWMEDVWHTLRHRQLFDMLRILGRKLAGFHEWDNLESLAATDQEYGEGSSFYFLPRMGMHRDIPHADYNVSHPEFQQLMDRLQLLGCEVGGHHTVPVNPEQADKSLERDLRRLNRPVQGGRYHYLHFDMRTTPGVLDRAKLQYDSTLGFAEHIGFRNGYAFPFFLYDHENNRPTGVQEVPLIIMDTTLRNPDYMNLAPSKVVERTAALRAEVQRFEGRVALLWHNQMFSGHKFAPWKAAYLELLDRLYREGATLETAYGALLPVSVPPG